MPPARHAGRRARYEPSGFLALDPRAFGWLFDIPEAPDNDVRDGVAIVTIRGPLEHHDESYWWDSYEAIAERVAKALEGAPKAVVLSIDSPGGLVSGCFDTARTLRAMARTAGVPLYAFVDGMATSAAYALACAADRIFVTDTSMTGSIGVIETLVDARAANEKWGVRVQLVTSGARKADGHPAAEISEDVFKVAQDRVDQLALSFFELVAEMRSGLGVNALRALEASIVIGADAVRLGLADELATFDRVLAVASGKEETDMPPKASKDMDDAVAKLRKAAENDDEEGRKAKKMLAAMEEDDDSRKAKKMLAAMEEDDDSDEGKGKGKAEDEPEKKEEGKSKKAKAEDDEPTKDEGKGKAEDEPEKDDDAKAIALAAMKDLHALRAERAAEKEALERKELLATRPDFDEKTLAFLQKCSIEQVRDAVASFPRGPVRIPQNPHAAAAQPGATRGEGQGDSSPSRLPPEQARALDEKMGIRRQVSAVEHDGTSMKLRTMTKAEAREYAKQKAAAPN